MRVTQDEVLSENYLDRPCSEAATEFSSLEDGLYARYGSGAPNLIWFFILMAFLAYILQALLVKRRNNIINEVYSKLSIVKTKNWLPNATNQSIFT